MVTDTVMIYRVRVKQPDGSHEVLFVREDRLGPWRKLRGVQVTPLCEWTPMVTPGGAP